MDIKTARNYLEIDLQRLENNTSVVRRLVGEKVKIMGMVKGDAYGHGIQNCIKIFDKECDCYGVASFEEATKLRNSGTTKDIMIFGWVPFIKLKECIKNQFIINIFSLEYGKQVNSALQDCDKKIRAHLEIDTGLGRTGFRCYSENEISTVVEEIKQIFSSDKILVEGGFTHFASIDSTKEEDIQYAEMQHSYFKMVCSKLEASKTPFKIKHVSCSTAILRHRELDYDLVRAGKILYGIGILPEDNIDNKIVPALSWRARVILVKTLKEGDAIGYGRTFKAKHDSKIAILSVGYGDGYHRHYSNKTFVIINNKKVPVIGSVSMDFMVVDVSTIDDITFGDLATLIGDNPTSTLSIPTLDFARIGGANSEATACITSRVPRYYK
ncbi:MAG: alanine racemase [Sphaerochaetaceae bacterium]